jgi:ubiquinone/menaquinone biosynthesis C-methylase UbiE
MQAMPRESKTETIMDNVQHSDDEQAKLWNGPAGQAWVEAQDLLDRMFKPLEDLLVATVPAGSRVLDIGCGTGSTTLAAARQVGMQGECTGIDISEPMTATARARAAREGISARFLCADAQMHAFEPASFDMIMSRFGVMFFRDPVQAFANLRRAARNGAMLRLIAWRSAAENPFMTTAERAAAPLLPNLPARRPDAPGQFAFADQRRVHRILEESGWAGIDIRPIDVECTLPRQALNRYLGLLGPVGLALREADEWTRIRVIETVRTAFNPYIQGDEVRYTAACWMIGACAPATQ